MTIPAPGRLSISLTILALVASPALGGDVEVELSAGDGFVIKNAGGAINRLRVEEATGNISRNGALFVHTTGTKNTFVGEGAGSIATTGIGSNSAFGNGTLSSLTTGVGNSAFGGNALNSNTTGNGNMAFGHNVLSSNLDGDNNSAFGQAALFLNVSGSYNAAFGDDALVNNTASLNSAFGASAMESNTTGTENAAFGTSALGLNAVGSRNSAFGRDALRSSTASDNSAFGHDALRSNGASSNSAFGSAALTANTTGEHNAAFGSDALRSNQVGDENAAFGGQALKVSTTSGNSAFGYAALSGNTNGFSNSAFGRNAMRLHLTGGGNSVFGHGALGGTYYFTPTFTVITTSGSANAAFGSQALYLNNADLNSAFGISALRRNDTGTRNAAFGAYALRNNEYGSDNVAVGHESGFNQTTGSNNIYLANGGVAGENGQIKIGTEGSHTEAFIAGELALGAEDAHRTILTLKGPDDKDTGPIAFLYGDVADQVESGRIRFGEGTNETNWRGAFIHFDGSGNRLHLGTHDTNTDVTADDVNVLSIERGTHHVGIQRENPAHPLQVGTDTSTGNGAHVTAGGTWTNGSSRAWKEGFEALDPEAVLAKVSELPIQRWRYRGSDEGAHVGPMAEDFHAAFGLGASDAYIATVDADGVALAAIQGLRQQLTRQQSTIDALLARVHELESGRAEFEETEK